MALLTQSTFYPPADTFALDNGDSQFGSDFNFSIPDRTTGFTIEWDSTARWAKLNITTTMDFAIAVEGCGINLNHLNNPGNAKTGSYSGRFSLATAYKPSWLTYDLAEPTDMATNADPMSGNMLFIIAQYDGDKVNNLTKLALRYYMEYDMTTGVLAKSAMAMRVEESTITIDQ